MIFLTVGTQFPFDRMVKCVDEFIGRNGFEEEIFAQVGETSYKPRNFESVPFLEQHVFSGHMRRASRIISHAGVGIIALALDNNKPLLVMPRLKNHGEVVNDHQVAIARKFEELGHVLAAYSVKELPEKIKQLRTFVPKMRESQAHLVAQRITKFLNELSVSGR